MSTLPVTNNNIFIKTLFCFDEVLQVPQLILRFSDILVIKIKTPTPLSEVGVLYSRAMARMENLEIQLLFLNN